MICEECKAYSYCRNELKQKIIAPGCAALRHKPIWFEKQHAYGCRSSRRQIEDALSRWKKETPVKEKYEIIFIYK